MSNRLTMTRCEANDVLPGSGRAVSGVYYRIGGLPEGRRVSIHRADTGWYLFGNGEIGWKLFDTPEQALGDVQERLDRV
jgi:hypothetical protein